MNKNPNRHLTDPEILAALVDTGDLPDCTQRHLESCEACQKRLQCLEIDFTAFGRAAKANTPELPRPVRLESVIRKKRAARHGFFPASWGRRPAYGMAVAALLVMVVAVKGPGVRFRTELPSRQVTMETHEAEELFIEVDRLVENAMPRDYYELTGMDSDDAEEDYMEFIVPLEEENNTLSMIRETKGEHLC